MVFKKYARSSVLVHFFFFAHGPRPAALQAFCARRDPENTTHCHVTALTQWPVASLQNSRVLRRVWSSRGALVCRRWCALTSLFTEVWSVLCCDINNEASKMKYMTTCCGGCCDVEKGSKILSVLHLVCYVIGFIAFAAIAAAFDSLREAVGRHWIEQGVIVPSDAAPFQEGMQGIYIAMAVFFAIGIFVTALCVHGVFKAQRRFILPFLFFQVIIMVYNAISVIFTTVNYAKHGAHSTQIVANVVFGIVGILVEIYFYFVILSYYKQLEAAERNPHQSVAYAQAPPGPMPQYYTPGQGKV